jgi:uncharacterized protein YbjT (DUF2867 family)
MTKADGSMESSTTRRTIVVLGATGQQGGAVAQALVTDGRWQVRALSRDPASHAARLLSVAGMEVVRADMDDLDSLQHAMAGAYGVFSVQGTDRGGDIETARGIDVAEAARFAGVKHFIYSSVGGAERGSGIAHFESKWRVEEYIRAIGLPASIVRPTFFMDNFAKPSMRWIVLAMLRSYLPANTALQMVATQDIGRWVANAFAHPEAHIGRTEELAGDELTYAQIVKAFKRQRRWVGLPVPVPRVLLLALPIEVRRMFAWFGTAGYQADLAALRSRDPRLRRMDDWLIADGAQQCSESAVG